MKHEVNAMGKQCPIPVVMTKKVIDNAVVGDEIEILIDNETAVNNLSRLANKTGCTFVSEKLGDKKYQVKMAVKTEQTGGTLEEEEFVCEAPHKKVTVAAEERLSASFQWYHFRRPDFCRPGASSRQNVRSS